MKQFFITFFANLAALFFVFGGPMLLLFILIIASISAGASKKQHSTSIDRGSILVFDMSMNVTDSPEHATSGDALTNALSNNKVKTVALHRLLNAIKKASKDERIKGMLLEGSFEPADFGTGYACLKEVREAIADFKKGDGKAKPGKPVYAYLEAPSTRDYYVASVASTIWMNPYGEMEMPGLAVVKTYFKGALDKYGVDVQVTRHGKYKSATEPFFLTKMSDADREETQRLIDGLWGDFITAVTASRPIDAKTLQSLVDTEGYILPEHAKAAHLIDDTKYFGDVLTELGKIAPSSDFAKIPLPFKQVAIGDYITASHTPRLLGERGSDNVVAVLYLEGEIVDGEGELTNIGGDRFAAELRDLRKDSDVKAVVLRVNSPGGSAYASEVIQREIIALKASGKPVIVSMGNYAASGGYWVSTFADHIFAEPNTITGSIGVFGMFVDYQKLANNVGVTFDVAKTGQYADFESNARPKTDAEVALAQARVDDLYGKFLDKVSKSRDIPRGADSDPKTVDAIAQGRVWLGTDALPLHLIDEIGGLQNAITYAATKAKLGDRYRVKEYPEEVTFADTLATLLSHQQEPLSQAKADPLTQAFLKIRHDLKEFQGFNDPIGVYARMPIGWEIR